MNDADARLGCIIVDDEALARSELRSMLAAHPQLIVVGEAEDVETARSLLRELEPLIVFLDIQLIGESGFDLLPYLPPSTRVVFVTAYDEHAVHAFEVDALDYLLKPVRAERLAATVARLTASARPTQARDVLLPSDRLLLDTGERARFVQVSDITCITSERNYSRVWLCTGECALVLRSLRSWESRLPRDLFLRAHRSAIVSLAHIRDVRPAVGSSYLLRLTAPDRPLRVSRRRASLMRSRIP